MAQLRGSDVIDEAVDPGRAPIGSPVRPPPRAAKPPLEIAFELELWDVGMRHGAEAKRVEHVEVDGRYVLRVVALVSRSGPSNVDTGYSLYGDTLELTLWSEPSLAIRAENPDGTQGGPRATLDRAELADMAECSLEFAFEIPRDAPNQLTIQLDCGVEPRTRTAAVKQLVVRGGQHPMGPAQLPAFRVAIEPNVPDHFAFLYVSALQNDQLRVVAADVASAPLDVTIKVPKVLSLAKRLKRVLRSKDAARTVGEAELLLSDILQFSRDQGALQSWLRGILLHAGTRPLLVLHDSTALEVPWELFELGESYLGARVEIVRWVEVRQDGIPVMLSLAEAELCGCAAMFLGAQERLATEAEQAELRSIEAVELSSLHDALSWLNDVEGPQNDATAAEKAFLYIASHGETDDTGYNLDDTDAKFQEALAELLSSKRSVIVFVNACESALLRLDASGRYRGLAERLLGRVARGYIGTRAEVANDHAAAIGVEILRELRAPGARIPSVLFRLRERAARGLSRIKGKESEWLRFLHAFSYVYFGEPLASVRLSPTTSGELISGESAE